MPQTAAGGLPGAPAGTEESAGADEDGEGLAGVEVELAGAGAVLAGGVVGAVMCGCERLAGTLADGLGCVGVAAGEDAMLSNGVQPAVAAAMAAAVTAAAVMALGLDSLITGSCLSLGLPGDNGTVTALGFQAILG